MKIFDHNVLLFKICLRSPRFARLFGCYWLPFTAIDCRSKNLNFRQRHRSGNLKAKWLVCTATQLNWTILRSYYYLGWNFFFKFIFSVKAWGFQWKLFTQNSSQKTLHRPGKGMLEDFEIWSSNRFEIGFNLGTIDDSVLCRSASSLTELESSLRALIQISFSNWILNFTIYFSIRVCSVNTSKLHHQTPSNN